MGKDYCLCQGIFNKEIESSMLSSNKDQKDFSQKKFFNNYKEEPSEKETLTDSKRNNKLNFGSINNNLNNEDISCKKTFTFKDMNLKSIGKNINHNNNKNKNSIKSNIKEEDNEDEIIKEKNIKNNNYKKNEHLSYKSSKDNNSKNIENNKNISFLDSFNNSQNTEDNNNSNKINSNINKSINKNKNEDESISADYLLNDLLLADNGENKNNTKNGFNDDEFEL